jgi:hypothetical protein
MKEHEDSVEDGEIEEELTMEEIWDDSELIEAWNSAQEQYQEYHLSSEEPKKSLLPLKRKIKEEEGEREVENVTKTENLELLPSTENVELMNAFHGNVLI